MVEKEKSYINVEIYIPLEEEKINQLIYYGYDWEKNTENIIKKEFPEIYQRLSKEFDEVYRIITMIESAREVVD